MNLATESFTFGVAGLAGDVSLSTANPSSIFRGSSDASEEMLPCVHADGGTEETMAGRIRFFSFFGVVLGSLPPLAFGFFRGIRILTGVSVAEEDEASAGKAASYED